MGDALQERRATFKSMRPSTKQDWDVITTPYVPFARELPDRILAHFRLLGGDSGLRRGSPASLAAHRDPRPQGW